MNTSRDHADPRVAEQAREKSAEQRNITAPTPADVRAEAEEGRGHEAGEEEPKEEPPAGTPAS
ncbi:hypothetical protein ACPC54_20810 [Kitasatospora sp. NPDC094028]